MVVILTSIVLMVVGIPEETNISPPKWESRKIIDPKVPAFESGHVSIERGIPVQIRMFCWLYIP